MEEEIRKTSNLLNKIKSHYNIDDKIQYHKTKDHHKYYHSLPLFYVDKYIFNLEIYGKKPENLTFDMYLFMSLPDSNSRIAVIEFHVWDLLLDYKKIIKVIDEIVKPENIKYILDYYNLYSHKNLFVDIYLFDEESKLSLIKNYSKDDFFVKENKPMSYGMDYENIENIFKEIIDNKCGKLNDEEKENLFDELKDEYTFQLNENLPYTNYQYDIIEEQVRKFENMKINNQTDRYIDLYNRKVININIPKHPLDIYPLFLESFENIFEKYKCKILKSDYKKIDDSVKVYIYKKSDHPYIKFIKNIR